MSRKADGMVVYVNLTMVVYVTMSGARWNEIHLARVRLGLYSQAKAFKQHYQNL